jgi:hypothetical protein
MNIKIFCCFVPGRTKDLSAPLHNQPSTQIRRSRIHLPFTLCLNMAENAEMCGRSSIINVSLIYQFAHLFGRIVKRDATCLLRSTFNVKFML